MRASRVPARMLSLPGQSTDSAGSALTTIAILQSNYLPWKGYFDIIAAVDTFVLYDRVQYTKNDWRNRNRIKTPAGTRWITVPVVKGGLDHPINRTEIADREILRKHWSSISQSYRKAPAYAEMRPVVEPLFDRTAPALLSELNVEMLRSFCELLDIKTPIVSSDDLELGADRNLRLVEICEHFGADTYLSGPAARDYLDETTFTDRGVKVQWVDYSGYPEYEQPHPPFDHHVSVVDLVLSAGRDAPSMLRNGSR